MPRVAACSVLALLIACAGSDPTGNEPQIQIEASLTLSPDTLFFNQIGRTRQLTATVLDQDGRTIRNAQVQFRVSDSMIASVSASGIVTAIRNGRAVIGAFYQTVSDTMSLFIRAPEVDENTLAFISADIYTMRTDGTNLSKMTHNRQLFGTFAWSPDGRWILYEDRNHLILSSIDGSTETNLTAGGNGYQPAWSPSGQRIAFVSGRDGGPIRLWTMDAQGSNLLRLTDDPAVSPMWSPDGSRIVYVAGPGKEIHVINADGSGHRQLTNHARDDERPVWSPAGTRIAFTSDRDTTRGLYVMDAADGSNVTRMTSSDLMLDPLFEPAWSPDGMRIAFGARTSTRYQIFVVTVNGSTVTRVTASPTIDEYDPQWSVDGSRLAFRAGDRIVVVAADGSARQELFQGRSARWGPRR